MTPGIIGYVPPESIECSRAFFENVRAFKSSNPMVLYSDTNWPDTVRIPNPDRLGRWPNGMAFKNLIFLHGINLAHKRGFSHVLYLESDARVGRDNWDQAAFDEFKPESAAAGTLCYLNADPTRVKFTDDKFSSANNHHSAKPGTCIFPMGALAIYSVSELIAMFPGAIELTAQRIGTWDMEIGYRLWSKYGEESYSRIQPMTSIYSWYGNRKNNERERRQALVDGRFVAVHQIKSNWKPSLN